jgi:tRNA pseudouridine38-40 synthase
MFVVRRTVGSSTRSLVVWLIWNAPASWTLPLSSRNTFRTHSRINARGRGIPYVETLEEQTTRLYWETDPFDVARSVVNRLLSGEGKIQEKMPLLSKKERTNCDQIITGYEYLFNALYGCDCDLEELYGHLQATNTIPNENQRCFLLRLGYRGSDFCGWQTQPNNYDLPSVQQTLEERLAELEGSKVNVRVCGRTDAGVSAVGQVARYRSRLSDVTAAHVQKHLMSLTCKGVRCLDVVPVTKSFHPLFGAQTRAYIYLLDVTNIEKPSNLAQRIDAQLQTLQGRPLDYIALSYGRIKTQTSICTLCHAQAHLVQDSETGQDAIAVELVGDRFLRRMVRLLVENTLRIAVRPNPQPQHALLEHVESFDRGRSGKSCPPDGLIFVGATFEDP